MTGWKFDYEESREVGRNARATSSKIFQYITWIKGRELDCPSIRYGSELDIGSGRV